jgi:hypothetical protein
VNETEFPKHKCGLYLTHNQHRDYYDTIEEACSDSSGPNFKDEAARRRAISLDSIWELQWYPDTPISFYKVAAPTLREVLAFAKEVEISYL